MLETKLVSEYINAGAQVGNFEVGAQVFIKARIILNIVLAQVSQVLRAQCMMSIFNIIGRVYVSDKKCYASTRFSPEIK